MTWNPIPTFLCVEKLRTTPACIRLDDSAARPDDPQFSIKPQDFFAKHRYVDSHPDVLIHKASIVIQIQTSRRQSVQTCEHHIWKLCASDQPFRRPSSRFGHAKPLYRNYCSERLTVRTRLSNREDLQRNFWNFGRTFVCPDGLWLPSGRRLVLSSQTLIWTLSL